MKTAYTNRPSVVYLAVNLVNGKRYVGITSRTLRVRIYRHVYDASHGSRRRFPKAIRAHGIENFHFSVIAELASYREAQAEERRLITLWRPEYNLTAGGEGALGYRHTAESRKMMKAWRAEHPEFKARQGKLAPGSGLKGYQTKLAKGPIPKPWLGKPRDSETKRKISETKIARLHLVAPETRAQQIENLRLGQIACKKPVICVTDDGRWFPSVGAAAAHYGLNRTKVSSVLSGARKHTGGFAFSVARG